MLLLLLLKYYPEKEMLNFLLLKKKQKRKNVPNGSEQWFKKRTWLEKQALLYNILTSNARSLNMPESAKICPNAGHIPRYM